MSPPIRPFHRYNTSGDGSGGTKIEHSLTMRPAKPLFSDHPVLHTRALPPGQGAAARRRPRQDVRAAEMQPPRSHPWGRLYLQRSRYVLAPINIRARMGDAHVAMYSERRDEQAPLCHRVPLAGAAAKAKSHPWGTDRTHEPVGDDPRAPERCDTPGKNTGASLLVNGSVSVLIPHDSGGGENAACFRTRGG